MSLSAVIAAVAAVFKAIPPLAALGEKLLAWWQEQQNRNRGVRAEARRQEKDAEVDRRIEEAMKLENQGDEKDGNDQKDKALNGNGADAGADDWLRGSGIEQQQAADGASGFQGGGLGSAGVDPGCAEDNQSAGAGNRRAIGLSRRAIGATMAGVRR